MARFNLSLLLACLFVVPHRALKISKFQFVPHAEDDAPECRHDRSKALAFYKEGKADLFFYHITHHAGTYLGNLAEQNGLAQRDFGPTPDSHNFIMWGPEGEVSFPSTNLAESLPQCNSDHFVSMISMRDPIKRILAHDGMWETTATNNTDECNTDNYAIRSLIAKPVSQKLDDQDLIFAKKRLDMFDFVLIVEHLKDGAQMLCLDLGWQKCVVQQVHHASPADVLPPDVLQKWIKRNHYDLALYDYALMRALQFESNLMLKNPEPNEIFNFVQGPTLDLDEMESHQKWRCDAPTAN